MKLADYLSDAQIGDSTFAGRIGVTRQTLWRYKSGERRPEWDVLERISRETGGQVTPNDFLSDAPMPAVAEHPDTEAHERAKPLRCHSPHGSPEFVTEGQSR
ncbi:helix-turn-helix domain-containing protein [Methylobacterium terrae]|uniref:helix-turn-helix domain-containing protein n=1 Tax=Methylobacterium terrae TaxID=2202827 RepID=UPI001FDF72A1|nr:helix-turn-helix transcriptional regulator [Methylobacterium terrae]